MREALILISNDDGIQAPGLLALIEVAQHFGQLVIVAPQSPQSGMGHAISVGRPLRIYPETLPGGKQAYAINGTPADCVKMGTGILMDRKPDLILSGINHGSNTSVSSIYSGTLSAAREGAIQGIAAIGFSLCHYPHEADMEPSKEVVREILSAVSREGLAPGALLNVNIPYLPLAELKGIRITRQAEGRWVEEFDERTDPYGRKYYWLTGKYALTDNGEDSDEAAIAAGYVSVSPMKHDLTDYERLPGMTSWFEGKAQAF